MNDTIQDNEALETADLLDADGRVIADTTQAAQNVLTRVDQFIHDEPVKSVFIAVAIGYVIGRLRLII